MQRLSSYSWYINISSWLYRSYHGIWTGRTGRWWVDTFVGTSHRTIAEYLAVPDLNRCHQARNELSAPRSLTFSYLRVTVVSVEHIAAELLVVMPEQMVKQMESCAGACSGAACGMRCWASRLLRGWISVVSSARAAVMLVWGENWGVCCGW